MSYQRLFPSVFPAFFKYIKMKDKYKTAEVLSFCEAFM